MATAKKTTTKKTVSERARAVADVRKVTSLGKGQVHGFMDFVREQGVVGLAVGLAIGTAAGAAVKEIVNEFINPIVGFLIGGINLADLNWTILKPNAAGKGGLVIGWGAILSAIITLVATAFVVYLIVHYAKFDRLDKAKEV